MARIDIRVAALAAIVAGSAVAALAPYDMSGHWTGTLDETGRGSATVSADFTASSAKAFGGTMDVNEGGVLHCTVAGKRKKKVTLHVKCDGGSGATLKGTLDPTTNTLAGNGKVKGQHKRHPATFTLTKQPPA